MAMPLDADGRAVPDEAWVTQDRDALDDLMRLRRDLAHPPMLADWASLHTFWAYDHYRLICEKPDTLEDYPELPVRIRGAFGRALHGLEARRTTTGRGITHAYDVLFAPLAFRDWSAEIPRPVIVRANVDGRFLNIDIHVFGDAMVWSEDAAVAMAGALQNGVALTSASRARGRISVLDVVTRRVNAPDPPTSASYASLTFRTPVTVRLGERLSDDPRAILRSVLRRIGGMARWQGVALPPAGQEILAEIEALEIDASELMRYSWARSSRRQGDTPIPMRGFLGRLIVRGQLAAILPALCLAESCNTGSHASLGLGHFDLAFF